MQEDLVSSFSSHFFFLSPIGFGSSYRELFKQALWCDPQHPKAALVFHAWGVMEEKEGNHDVARELFKCGIRCDNRNERLWLTWAEMEDRLGEESLGHYHQSGPSQAPQTHNKNGHNSFFSLPRALAAMLQTDAPPLLLLFFPRRERREGDRAEGLFGRGAGGLRLPPDCPRGR